MRRLLIGALLVGCGSEALPDPYLTAVAPDTAWALGGEVLTVRGMDLHGQLELSIGEQDMEVSWLDDTTAQVELPRLAAGQHDIVLWQDEDELDRIERGLAVLPVDLRFAPAPEAWLPSEPADLRDLFVGSLDDAPGADLLAWSSEGALHLWSGQPGGSWIDAGVVHEGPLAAVALIDLDEDGSHELITCEGEIGALTVRVRPPGEAMVIDSAVVPAEDPASCVSIAVHASGVAVQRQDGVVDLLRNESRPGAPRLGATTDTPLARLEPGARLVVADVGGDRRPDLIALPKTAGGMARWWQSHAQGVRPGAESALPLPGCAAGHPLWEDLDGDGDLDLFVPCRDGQDRLLRGDGQAHWFDDTTASLPVDGADGLRATAADLDLDGQKEILVASWDAVDRLYGSLDGRWVDRSARLHLSAGRTRRMLALDADDDGDVDLITAGPEGARLWVAVPEGVRQD